MWWILIHLPIPFIILLRIKAGLNWHFIPMTLGGSVVGQVFGGAVSRRRKQHDKTP
jgi:ligand-binding sensor protein